MSADAQSKNDSRKCLIQAAAKLFARLGLDKCSTREIAKQSDSNISLISYYFGGKEGLYKEVMRDCALEISEKVQKIFEFSDSHPQTKENFIYEIEQMVEVFIWMRVNHPEIAKIFAREKLGGMPHSKEIHQEIFYPLVTKFYEIFRSGQKNGFVKPDIHPALFFISLSEGIWGFFQMLECKTKLSNDCSDIANDHSKLKNQILQIYLTGVLK